jgi:conjugative relaxase-like TrwC/TraI family protein
MLRLAKVHRGGERYYFQTVAATTDLPDGLVEPDPFWLGRGAAGLGLEGTAGLPEVRAILAGADPASGEVLAPRRRQNLAYDVVLSVPKSVSLLHALASPELSGRIERAHLNATAATFEHLERDVLCARRTAGTDGARLRWTVGIDGALAMAAVHRTSRAADPHLHTHLVVANLAEGDDGRWSALDGQHLFEAHLRHELTGIGIDFGPMKGDFADVAGISPETIRAFSRQSQAIAEAVKAAGVSTRDDVEAVAQAIRPEKDRSRPYEELLEEWRERGYRLGLSQNRIDRAAGFGVIPGRTLLRDGGWATQGADTAWIEAAAGRHDGTFSRGDLVVARCSALRVGAAMGAVQAAVDAALASPEVVAGRQPGRYTTPRQLEIMQEAADRIGSLGRETGAMVLSYDGGDPRGRVGALEAATAPQATGDRTVYAVAPGQRAAERFEASTGIASFPVKRSHELEGRLGPRDVVVVADAGVMLEAELAGAMALCRTAGATPVLVGAQRSMAWSPVLDVLFAQAPRIEADRTHAAEQAVEAVPLSSGLPLDLHEIGPGVQAIAAPGIASACDTALARARELEAAGRSATIVVPDRSLKAEVQARADLSGTSVPVMDSGQAAKELARRGRGAHPTPSLVVIGGPDPMHLDQDRLTSVERTHVVVVPWADRDPAAARERVTNAVARPRMAAELGRGLDETRTRQLAREPLGRGLGR